MKLLNIYFSVITCAILLVIPACKETIDDILPKENPYDESITWSGYYNAAQLNPFSGAYNEVSFLFDKEVDGNTYQVVIENTNLNQLSLQLLSIKLKNAAVGNYDLKDAAVGSMQHYKDFNKKTDFTAINNGTLTISSMLNKDEITGSFNGWGLSGNDTLYLTGTFNRKKK